MKVDERFIKETIDEYNQKKSFINEHNNNDYPTIEMNGGVYKVVDMSLSEFTQYNKAVNMEDIKWT